MSMTPDDSFLSLVLVALWTAGSLVLGVVMGWRMRAGLAPIANPFPRPLKEEPPKTPAVVVKKQEAA